MDKVLASRRCPNDLSRIVPVLEPHKAELAGVVVESTYNWYWLVDGLMAAGYEVKLANTVAMKRYDGLKHSGDEDDAAHLAHLLRLGILPTGYIHPPSERGCAIWHASASSWCARARSTCWQSRTFWRGNWVRPCRAMPSNG